MKLEVFEDADSVARSGRGGRDGGTGRGGLWQRRRSVGLCKQDTGSPRALVHEHFSARQGVEDDHMNIICMGARTIGPFAAWDLVETFLGAEFSQAERHLRRLGKVASLEPEVISDRRGAGTTPRKT